MKLRRKITRNGIEKFFWACLDCGGRHANQRYYWVSRKDVDRWRQAGRLKIDSIRDIPIVADYSDDVACIICGCNGAEYHHLAPQSLSEFFDEYSQWPGMYLCRKHHQQWHNIVTWYLPGRTDVELAHAVRDKFLKEGLYR